MSSRNLGITALTCVLMLLLASGCAQGRPQAETIPLVPMEQITQWAGQSQTAVLPMRADLHIRDVMYPHFGYLPNGESFGKYIDEVLFPTDVLIVLTEGEVRHVFLARSPHGGCLIRWNGGWPYSELPNWAVGDFFDEPCYGSRWDINGQWVLGPSPRNMDALPFEIREDMLWITGEITYGQPHP